MVRLVAGGSRQLTHSDGDGGEGAPLFGRRVLVIGINYWPEPTGIAPYTTGMAEHLAELGASVRVLTGVPHYPTWRVSAAHRRRLASREWLRGVEVVRLRHSVPRRMTAVRRAIYEGTFFAHAALRGLREAPDMVLAITPALGGAVAAASVARRVGCPLVVVVQDLMAKAAGQSGITGGSRLTGVTARIEGAALRRATTVAVVSESFRPGVEAYGVRPDRIQVLRNWTHITALGLSRAEARSRLGWPVDGFLVLHTGNMGFKQDLGNLIEAARRLPESAVRVVLVGDGSQRRSLERQATGLSNVRFSGLVDEALYPVVLAAADMLVVNERPGVGEMSLPSKITSYLAAGKPVIAAVSRGGAADLELRRTGGAARVVEPGNPTELAAVLAGLATDGAQLDSMSSAATSYAKAHLGRTAALRTLSRLVLHAQGDHR